MKKINLENTKYEVQTLTKFNKQLRKIVKVIGL